jgi:hypothetical protein
MNERYPVAVGEKLVERPVPHVRLRQGKYGMKLDIVRDGNILQRALQALDAVELHPLDIGQVFLFASCAVGFWSGNYAVFMCVFHEHSFQAETIGRIKTTYAFFGIDGTARPVPLGLAKHPSDIASYLSERGIGILDWYPVHQMPEHFGSVTAWTDYDIHSCMLRMAREGSRLVLVQGE